MTFPWLRSFRNALSRSAPTIVQSRFGQSRRVEGWFDVDKELHCFQSVHCFFQRGLEPYARPVGQVLQTVHSFQKDRERGPYIMRFHLFGLDEDGKRPGKSLEVWPSSRMPHLAKRACKNTGPAPPTGASALPRLLTGRQEDLWLFLCCNRIFRLDEEKPGGYKRLRGKSRHAHWFFFGDTEPVWMTGKDFLAHLAERNAASDPPTGHHAD